MIKRFIRFLGGKPLRSYAILLLVVCAAPFAGEMAALIDIIAVLGTDVLVLSVLLYFRESLLQWARPTWTTFRAYVERHGLLWPSRDWFKSTEDLGRYVTYNFDILERPLRIATCTMLAVALAVILQPVFP